MGDWKDEQEEDEVQFLLSFEIKENRIVSGSGEEENEDISVVEKLHGWKEADAVVVVVVVMFFC